MRSLDRTVIWRRNISNQNIRWNNRTVRLVCNNVKIPSKNCVPGTQLNTVFKLLGFSSFDNTPMIMNGIVSIGLCLEDVLLFECSFGAFPKQWCWVLLAISSIYQDNKQYSVKVTRRWVSLWFEQHNFISVCCFIFAICILRVLWKLFISLAEPSFS